jgi:hypothetical protein
MKQRNTRSTGRDESQRITRAVTHIRLEEANAGKLAALDDLAQVYLSLCQQYVILCAQRGATLSVARERDLTQVM